MAPVVKGFSPRYKGLLFVYMFVQTLWGVGYRDRMYKKPYEF